MQPKVIFENAHIESVNHWGWFLGQFIPTADPRSTPILEVQWAVHKAGDNRSTWAMNVEATTLSILIRGRFRIQFPEQEFLLSREGDYLLCAPGVPHCWSAEVDDVMETAVACITSA